MNFKKPKFWDLQKPNTLSLILLPFTIIIKINNLLLNLKRKKSNLNIKTICVGNIYIGGTGKTPLSIETIKILNDLNYKTCFIKKKYLDQIDEQNILKSYGNLICTKHRDTAFKIAENQKYDVAILDDGLQEKNLGYKVTFVCFNSSDGIGNGLFSIARGSLPLAFYGGDRYPSIIGALARPWLMAQSCAPILGILLIIYIGPQASLKCLAVFSSLNIILVSWLWKASIELR